MDEYIFDSPIGRLHLKATNHALTHLTFIEPDANELLFNKTSGLIDKVITQLGEYFGGKRRIFDLPLSAEGTDFQQKVWQELQKIPYGQTTTYSRLSHKLGDPKAIRAVGKANGQNPIAVIIPCHRVIGANNNLIGYAGGIERKRWLLQHEGSLLL